MEINHFIPLLERLGAFALLAIIILACVFKIFPYIFKQFLEKFDEMNKKNNEHHSQVQEKYTENIRQISEVHRMELGRIADKFEKSVENSTNWHQKHSQDVAEIKNLLIGKGR